MADFNEFADNSDYWAESVYTRLETDVNLAGAGDNPDGSFSMAVIAPDTGPIGDPFEGIPFRGVFDGNDHIISNLTIDTLGTNSYYLSLFGQIVGSGAEVKNLGVEDVNITGGDYSRALGGLCGQNLDTIENCFWDVNSSGLTQSDGGESKTTEQMQTESTFTDAGWDFVWETANGPNDIWVINDGFGNPKHVWKRVNLVGWYEVDLVDYAAFSSWWQQECRRECNPCDIIEDGNINFWDFAVIVENWELSDCNSCNGADLTGDGNVNVDDMYEFADCWLVPYDCSGSDIDFSGLVDAWDLKIFCENWLEEK